MNLEEVKEYFKDAKQVKCLVDNKIFNIEVDGNYENVIRAIVFRSKSSQNNNANCVLYDNSKPLNKLAEIISYKEKDLPEYPIEGIFEERVMLVSDDEENWWPRVVFMEKNNRFIAWNYAKTIEEAGEVCKTTDWKYAKELPIEIEVTKEEIAKWKGCLVEQLIIK